MTKKEIEKKIAEMEAGIEELKEELERAEDSNPDVFIPKDIEEYWAISDKGSIYNSRWDGDTIDEHRLAIGNVFRTKEEAEFEIERLKVIYELRQYAEPRCMKWDGAKRHFFIVYDIGSNNIKTDYCFWYKQDSLSFSSEDKAWEAIKAVGEDRVKKYYLCVEEDNI